MKPVLLCLAVFATFLLHSSAAPLDKGIDDFNRILGLDVPKPDKKSLSKKGKPPGKPPGPKLFKEIGFEFLSQIPVNMIPKLTSPAEEDNDQQRKKHLIKKYSYFAPLHKEPKKTKFSNQKDASKDDRTIDLMSNNQNHMIQGSTFTN